MSQGSNIFFYDSVQGRTVVIARIHEVVSTLNENNDFMPLQAYWLHRHTDSYYNHSRIWSCLYCRLLSLYLMQSY